MENRQYRHQKTQVEASKEIINYFCKFGRDLTGNTFTSPNLDKERIYPERVLGTVLVIIQ